MTKHSTHDHLVVRNGVVKITLKAAVDTSESIKALIPCGALANSMKHSSTATLTPATPTAAEEPAISSRDTPNFKQIDSTVL